MPLVPRQAPLAAFAALTLLAACDTAGFDPLGMSPSRPQVDIPKEVTIVSTAELVGTWTCRELDPYPDQPMITTTMTLGEDGRISSETLLPMAGQVPGATDMIMTMTGNWRVEGDQLITTDSDVEMAAADGSAGGISAMMNSIAASFMDRAGDGSAEIFRVTATELVMRGEDEDAATLACLREA